MGEKDKVRKENVKGTIRVEEKIRTQRNIDKGRKGENEKRRKTEKKRVKIQ